MKYIDEFRDQRLAQKLIEAIRAEVKGSRPDGQPFRFMEFCGGHTHAIFRFGLPDLLPPEIQMIHGPGCPVCVLPMSKIDAAIQLAQKHKVTLCTYGDMMRVPGGQRISLLKAKAAGADIRMVTSPHDAVVFAKENPLQEVVFFAIGFETTTPPTAVVVKLAQAWGLKNFSVFCNHVLTPPALKWLLEASKDTSADVPPLDGFVGPSHVSAIIGTTPYEIAAHDYGKPVVITGFEPLDVLQAILMLVRQVKQGRAEVENEYARAVTADGNVKAQGLMAEVFDLRDTFEWRGLGFIPNSALKVKDVFASFDAEKRFPLDLIEAKENPACQCPAILRGAKSPPDCKLFGTVCMPENPIGACMVSSEGGCAAWYSYGRRTSSTSL
ncbi:MAG: hydrogenase formation protein HypD [Alphaproteobacteria bacterium]|nr:hydrogenase formation protein HypD [Alphaproteobacteria bacterium]